MTPARDQSERRSNFSNLSEPCGDFMASQTDGELLGLSDLFSRLSLSDNSNNFSISKINNFTDKTQTTPNVKKNFFNFDNLIDKISNFTDNSVCFTDENCNSADNNDCFTDKNCNGADNNDCFTDKNCNSADNNDCFTDENCNSADDNDCCNDKESNSNDISNCSSYKEKLSTSKVEVKLNNDNKPCIAMGDTATEINAEPPDKKENKKYYAVALQVGMEVSGEGSLIYSELKDALKAIKTYKGSRFKEFTNKEAALKYTLQPINKIERKKSTEGERLKHRTSQELCKIRKMIERGDEAGFAREVWMYPRTLVTDVDVPTVMQHGVRFNALHVAAKCNKPLICQLILDILENPYFADSLYPDDPPAMRFRRMFQLRDLYLNTGTQKTGDTPLHYAAKFGCLDCCKVLIAHPQCDIDKKNVDGLIARETILSRVSYSSTLKEKMEAVFEEGLVYVPVLKSNSDVSPPIVGKPCACKDIDRCASLLTDDDPKLSLKAFAGPMSPKMAQQFYRALKNPTSPRYSPFTPEEQGIISKIKQTDFEKAVERIGRSLAEDMQVDWQEYFPDFNVFSNFATKEGLTILEARLKKLKRGESFSIFSGEEPFEKSIALVKQFPSHVNPLKHRVNVFYSLSEKAKIDKDRTVCTDEVFKTPPSSPEFLTPPTSPCGSPEREKKTPVFLNGPSFTELDREVYEVIRYYNFRPKAFPNVYRWKKLVSAERKNHPPKKHRHTSHKDVPSHKSRIHGKEFKSTTRKKLF